MKKLVFIFVIIILIAILVAVYYWNNWTYNFLINEVTHSTKNYLLSILTIPNPEIPQKTPFERNWKSLRTSYPYVASVPIDINNTGHELLFLGGGINQDDVLLDYQDGKLVNVIGETNLSDKKYATYGGVSVDMDKDGYSDLIVARQNGVFLYKNNKNGTFSKKQILQEQSDKVPVSLAVTDYNKDGNPDIYVSYFIKSKNLRNYHHNDPMHSKANVLLKGEGNQVFRDVTHTAGVAGKHNTFTSVFTDLDNDNDPDLISANDAGEIEIYENVNGQFIKKKMQTGFGFWMGIGVGDIDNDLDQDLFISNLGPFIPTDRGVTSGPKKTGIRKGQKLNHQHVILRNDGNFKFVDLSKDAMNGYGFGWGGMIEDVNLDTKQDLAFGVNYMDNPLHNFLTMPNPLLIQKDSKFKLTHRFPNFSFGQTPLSMDINRDQIKDIIWVNMKGPLKVYANINYENNNFINVRLPNSFDFTNAKVYVYADGQKFMKENIQGGVGFGGDQSELFAFGLGKIKKVDKVEIKTIYGQTFEYQNPKINSTLVVIKKI